MDSPRPCAELLLTAVIGCDRMRLYMEPERVASDQERETLRDWVSRAAAHEPVQYLVGEAWFHGRLYEVDRSTLIPRPATEVLVDQSVAAVRDIDGPNILEIGTGTGCVITAILDALDRPNRAAARRKAAAIADGLVFESESKDEESEESTTKEEPEFNPATAVAIELVEEAVELARRNIERHGFAERVDIKQGSLFEPLKAADRGRFDLLVANPPYVSDSEWARCEPNVRDYEPESALRAGPDGLAIITPLIEGAVKAVRPGGVVAIEIQYDQGAAVAALFQSAGLTDVEVHKDLEDHDRVVVGRRPS